MSDLNAIKENTAEFLLSTVLSLDALMRTEKIIPNRLLNKGVKETRIKI